MHFGTTLGRLESSPDEVSALLTHEDGTTETVTAQYASFVGGLTGDYVDFSTA